MGDTSLRSRPFARRGKSWARAYIHSSCPLECNCAWVPTCSLLHSAFATHLRVTKHTTTVYCIWSLGTLKIWRKTISMMSLAINDSHNLIRPAFLPGDNANIGRFPEPSSPCEWSGSETRHMYLTCIICSSLSKSP